jgi:hypothetical protein
MLRTCLQLWRAPARALPPLARPARAPWQRLATRASAVQDGQLLSPGVLGRKLQELGVRVDAMQKVCALPPACASCCCAPPGAVRVRRAENVVVRGAPCPAGAGCGRAVEGRSARR